MRSRAPSGKLKYPLGNSIRITRGLHPSGALARTLWQVKSPPSDSIQITWGARGLHPTGALARTLWRIETPLERFYPNHPRARGLHPSGALERTLWQVKSPPGDSVQITWGLLSGTKYWVPKEVELITIKR